MNTLKAALANRIMPLFLALALIFPGLSHAVTLTGSVRGNPSVLPTRMVRPVTNVAAISPLRNSLTSAPVLKPGALAPSLAVGMLPMDFSLADPQTEAATLAAMTAPGDIAALPLGAAGDQLVGAARSLIDSNQTASMGSRLDIVFDKALAAPGSFTPTASPSEEEFEMEEAAESPASRQAQALHKVYDIASAKRFAAFDAEVALARVGRFGLSIDRVKTQQGMRVNASLTLDGKPTTDKQVQGLIAAGSVSAQEYQQAKLTLQQQAQALLRKLQTVMEEDEKEHQAVHRKMAALERTTIFAELKKRNTKGMTMQSWGLPNTVPINLESSLRYTKLYLLGGTPTELGSELHDLMVPLIAADPTFLARVTQKQLLEAVQLLQDSLKYRSSPESMATLKHMRMGLMAVEEGFDYPEWRKVFQDRARQALTRTPEAGEKLVGLGAKPAEQQTSVVLEKTLMDAYTRFDEAQERGADVSELQPLQEVILSLHVAMGLPIPTQNGLSMIQVTHRQLKPLLGELQRVNAHEAVIKDAIRAFPMGESLLRLGVHKLWAKGLTGEGLKVAVIDDGVDFSHPDLSDAAQHAVNMTRDRGDMVKGPHGTAMADILHALAPGAEIQSYKVLSNSNLPGVMLNLQESLDLVMAALDKARAGGAKIISMSLGAPMGYGNGAIADKIAALVKDGIAVIVSAGNSGGELPPGLQVGTPGSSPEAITVGAVDYHGRRAGFSSKGMVFNPADYTINDKPDIYTYGVNVKAAVRLPGPLYQQEMVPFMPVSGTSPATPHIAAVVAMMYEAAQKAGLSLDGPAVVAAVRAAMREAATSATGVPVLVSAEKAVEKFIRLLTPIV